MEASGERYYGYLSPRAPCGHSAPLGWPAAQQPQQLYQLGAAPASVCPQHQPICSQLYQPLHTYCRPLSLQPAPIQAANEQQQQQQIEPFQQQQQQLANLVRPQLAASKSGERPPRLSLNLLHHQQQQQQQLAQKANLNSILRAPSGVAQLNTLSAKLGSPSGSLGSYDLAAGACFHWSAEPMNRAQGSQAVSQRRRLVERASGGSGAGSLEGKAASSSAESSRLKSLLMHLVLASNIPFAYAIILVAFLITVIAATSIITILTVVLTITGYTAYPITENTFNTSLAVGVVCASFALALVTASLVVWRRHCQAAYYYLDEPQSGSHGTNSPQLSETYDDSEYGSVPVSEWAKHVQKLHVDGDIGFSREFEQIQQATNQNLSFEHSQLAENKHKNRYINIVAYDHTRVTLRTLPGQKKPGSDYINANFIDVSSSQNLPSTCTKFGPKFSHKNPKLSQLKNAPIKQGYNKPRAYIGTQGPLVSTFDDYWRMIWEQRVVIIVMITNLQERGRVSLSRSNLAHHLTFDTSSELILLACAPIWPLIATNTAQRSDGIRFMLMSPLLSPILFGRFNQPAERSILRRRQLLRALLPLEPALMQPSVIVTQLNPVQLAPIGPPIGESRELQPGRQANGGFRELFSALSPLASPKWANRPAA